MNKSRSGFTLLEVMVAITILALIMRFAMPNIGGNKPRYIRDAFVARLNALTHLAWQRALVTHKIQRVTFDMGKSQIMLSEQTDELESNGEPKFAPSTGGYVKSSFNYPNTIDIKNFFIEGHDEMKRSGSKAVTWFYVVPEGLAQEVIINFTDKSDRIGSKMRKFKLELNPFDAQFSLIGL